MTSSTDSSTMFPADSTILRSVGRPSSVTTHDTPTDTESPDLSFGASFFGYSGESPLLFLGGVSTSASSYTRSASATSGFGVGGVVATTTARKEASRRARFPGTTFTRAVKGSKPSLRISTRWVPGFRVSSAIGVIPTPLPPTETAAPAGVDRISALPTAGGGGG